MIEWAAALSILLTLFARPISIRSAPSGNLLDKPNYFFEFLTFRGENDSTTFLEIFCQIPVQDFYFERSGSGYCANYNLSICLFDSQNNKTAWEFYSDSVHVQHLDDFAQLVPHVIYFPFQLKAGEYTAKVRITDLEKLSIIKFRKDISIPDYDQPTLRLSALQVASMMVSSDDPSFLVKNKMKISPNVDHRFGLNHKKLFIYSEIYNLSYLDNDRNRDFEVSFKIRNYSGRVVKSMRFDQPKLASASFLRLAIPIANLNEGKYELSVQILDRDSKQSTQRSTYFYIHNQPMHLVESFFFSRYLN